MPALKRRQREPPHTIIWNRNGKSVRLQLDPESGTVLATPQQHVTAGHGAGRVGSVTLRWRGMFVAVEWTMDDDSADADEKTGFWRSAARSSMLLTL